jgi:hypothetical protein
MAMILVFLLIAVQAQQAPINCKGPLSEEQLIGLLKARVDDVRVQAIVKQCGIGFTFTSDTERMLRSAGASDEVIAAVRARAPKPPPPELPLSLITWVDPNTKLMWAHKDNGSDVNWTEAMGYCRQLRLGGFSNWRLPEIGELEGIYDDSLNQRYKLKGDIRMSSYWAWSATRQESGEAWIFGFLTGPRFSNQLVDRYDLRALCVRRSKE